MKRFLSMTSALVLILIALCGALTTAAAAAGDPVLYTNKWTVAPGEPFALSWNEPKADSVLSIWRRSDTSDYVKVGEAANKNNGYRITLDRPGRYYFCLMAVYNGQARQSAEIQIDVVGGGSRKPSVAGNPLIYCNKPAVEVGERFCLSWYEDRADGEVWLWKRWGDHDYEFISEVPKRSDGYELSLDKKGTWYFSLMVMINGEAWQSDEYCVLVGADPEDAQIRLMEEKGMTNVWNVLFVIYEKVDIDGFKKAFTSDQISAIEEYAKYFKYTVESVTGGWMQIGEVETVRYSAPVTSASSGKGTDCRALTYGPGGDVSFNGLLENRDINLVAVWAPLSGLKGTEGWLGLAPFIAGSGDTECSVLIINDVDTKKTYYSMDGVFYIEEMGALVHEMLHCIEYNSGNNGWNGFQALHDVEQNGYRFEHSNLLWYRDLTRDELKNGRRGFKRISFYVKHR